LKLVQDRAVLTMADQ